MASDSPIREPEHADRHATWMELFFDLVAVAGIGQLTHLLHHGPSPSDFALYAVAYLAFWMVWACVTLYGDIARDQTRIALMLAAMLGLGLMVAAVAGIPERHSTTFAAVYVVVRMVTDQVWGRGRVVVDWPTAQFGAGTLPWIVSLWVPEPWKYWLWAAGLAVDMWVMFAISGERMMAGAQEALDRRLRRSRRFEGREPPKLEALHADPAHLGERLGLFVIIVLGEGVIVVVDAVGGVAWTARVLALGLAAFVVLTGMWALTLNFGIIPRMMSGTDPAAALPSRHIMAQHCWLTGAIATVTAGLGLSLDHVGGHLTTGIGWVLGGGAAAYFLITGLGGAHSGAGWRWTIAWPIPCAALAVLLGALGPHLGALWLVWGLAALILWSVAWETHARGLWPRRRERR
ncbi:low temperature requirement protein LtrA [Nocardia transvalensis]|uniref:Low temperature requirement protein LtrA n=1 Tax=Nocardia transvalensis TaxID=37333 RepID=A0A7W9UH14_9NOCA|nr:low temperature requirement protein A [Nocardia transvalensis]MBB5912240.1 low temperature requirement protein LtrA [Nocardia transvalensis]